MHIPLSLIQFIPPAPVSLLSSTPMKSGICSQPKQSTGHDPPMTSCNICSDTGGVFQILLVIVSDILRVWWVLVGFFCRGFPQLCFTLTSASDNQKQLSQPICLNKHSDFLFFLSSSTAWVYSTRKSRNSDVHPSCHAQQQEDTLQPSQRSFELLDN